MSSTRSGPLLGERPLKVLIQDSRPDRLVAWLTQVQRPGRTCHLANTAHQAQIMLLSDPYDLVMLEVTRAQAGTTPLGALALQRNPDCRIVDLPETIDAPAETPKAVQWRKFRAARGRVVTEASGVTWRAFRSQVADRAEEDRRAAAPEPTQVALRDALTV